MIKKWRVLTAFLAIVLVLTACGKEEVSPAPGAPSITDESAAYPLTVKPTISSTESEAAGTIAFDEVTFESMPKNIVVFDYGFLDTLDALGVEGITGVVKSSLPSHLKEKYNTDNYTNIGSLKDPLFEDIAAIEPDVIFISGRQSGFYEELSEIAPVVFVGTSQDNYWETFLASVDIAASMFDKEAEKEAILAQYDDAIKKINDLASGFDTTLVTMFNEGKLSGFSTNSRFGYMYDVYGFKPVTEDIEASSHGSNFGFEALLEFDPQVILVIDRTTATTGATSTIETDFPNEIVQKTQSYKNNRIIYLDGPLWYVGGGGLTSELAKINEILDELK